MMKNVSKFSARKQGILVALMACASVVAVPAFAQSSGGGMDVSSVLSTIAAAVVVAGTIGAAWVGFKYLKKAWNKV